MAVDDDFQSLLAVVAHEQPAKFLGVQLHVLCDPAGDRQPDRVRGQHERPVFGERLRDGAQQRVDAVGYQHLGVAPDHERVRELVRERLGRQGVGGGRDVIDREGHHSRTVERHPPVL